MDFHCWFMRISIHWLFNEVFQSSCLWQCQRLAMLSRVLVRLTLKPFVSAFSAIIPFHLEYCVKNWLSSLSGDVNELERLHRVATLIFSDLCVFTYENYFDNMYYSRCSSYVFNKINILLNRLSNSPGERLLKIRPVGNRRRHSCILYATQAIISLRNSEPCV